MDTIINQIPALLFWSLGIFLWALPTNSANILWSERYKFSCSKAKVKIRQNKWRRWFFVERNRTMIAKLLADSSLITDPGAWVVRISNCCVVWSLTLFWGFKFIFPLEIFQWGRNVNSWWKLIVIVTILGQKEDCGILMCLKWISLSSSLRHSEYRN